MDNNGSIVEFFYNIVPGSLFLFSLQYFGFNFFTSIGLGPDPVLIVFGYIVLGLFLGFFFQGITKLVREKKWNESIARRVKANNNNHFEESYKEINNLKKYIAPEEFITTFYLMDNSLRGEKAAFLPTHFSSRFAFWANMFFASISLAILSPVLCLINPGDSIKELFGLLILLLTIWISMILSDRYFDGFYETILKSYYMLKVKKD